MPPTQIVFFSDQNKCPVLDWLDTLPKKVQAKAHVRIERLAEMGHELRRPEADLWPMATIPVKGAISCG